MDDYDALVEDLPDEIVDFIGELQSSVEDLTKRLEEADAPDPDGVDDREPLEKAFDKLDDDEAAAVVEKLERLESLEERVTKAEEDAADVEYISKARAYDGLGDPDTLGPAMRRLAELAPEDAAIFEKAFLAAAEQSATSDLYEELGHEIHKSTDVDTQIEAIAKSYQEANPQLTEADAKSQAWENNPELYDEHRIEQTARQRL